MSHAQNRNPAHALAGSLALLLLAWTVFPAQGHAADWAWTQGQGWAQSTGVARDTPSQQFNHAYELEQSGQFHPAAQAYFLLVETFPHSEEAASALQRLARCLFHMENYYSSFKAIEQVMLSYPRMTRNKANLVEIQFAIGQRFQEGARVNPVDSNEPPRRGAEAAAEIFQAVVRNDPFGPHAGPALLALGDTYRKLGRPRDAQDQYNRVINEFSANEHLVDQARIGLQECAVSLGEASVSEAVGVIRNHAHEIARRDGGSEEARGEIENLQRRVSDLEEADAQKLMDEARFYNRRGTHESRKSARWICERILEEYPRTAAADDARTLIASITIPAQRHRGWRVPFLRRDEDEQIFEVPGPGPDHVTHRPVPTPIPGMEDAPRHVESVAGPRPRAPARTTTPVSTPPTTPGGLPPVMEAQGDTRRDPATDPGSTAFHTPPPPPAPVPSPAPAPVAERPTPPPARRPDAARGATPPAPPGGIAPSAIPATLGRSQRSTTPAPGAAPQAQVPPTPAPVPAPRSASPVPPISGAGAIPRGRVTMPDEMNP